MAIQPATPEAMRRGETVEVTRHQPLMALTTKRLECTCGALAIYMLIALDEENENGAHAFFCQRCFEESQEDEA